MIRATFFIKVAQFKGKLTIADINCMEEGAAYRYYIWL